ncbi:hypothetical protein [Dactylosporangium salmoneum]|uniref:DUF4034 domain-containing protein n=1 Tax=Dactylosporangium salmoneum TaxID=53361 RepID=A0ABP5TSN5_9ACTN
MPLFRRSAGRVAPGLDPTLGDADARWLWAALAAGDWLAARPMLAAERAQEDLDFLVSVAAQVPGTEHWLAHVIEHGPDDPLALLVRGHRAIAWAWEARTGLFAAYVPPERWVLFRQRLELAEYCLQEVVRREPANVTAWTGLITVARGLGLSANEQRRRFDAAVAHDPDNYRAHTAMLQNLCRKWGGSPERMRAFAERAARDAGEGSRLGTLVALAHLEHWLDLGGAPSRDYIRSAAVRESLNDAARESVRHRRYVRRRDWALDANAFAVAFLAAGDDEAAAMQFLAIGELVTEFPWCYLGEPVAAFRSAASAVNARTAW